MPHPHHHSGADRAAPPRCAHPRTEQRAGYLALTLRVNNTNPNPNPNPNPNQVHARLGGLSLALLDERVRGVARPEELLNAAVQGVVLALSLDQVAALTLTLTLTPTPTPTPKPNPKP